MEDIENLQQAVNDYQSQLDKVEKQIAQQSDRVDPALVKKREELRARINQMQHELTEAESTQDESVGTQPRPSPQDSQQQVQPPNVAQENITSAAPMEFPHDTVPDTASASAFGTETPTSQSNIQTESEVKEIDDVTDGGQGALLDRLGDVLSSKGRRRVETRSQARKTSKRPAVEDTLPNQSFEEVLQQPAQTESYPMSRLSPSGRQAVRLARAIGQEIGRSFLLTTEALLIALNQKADGPTQAILIAFGYPPENFYAWINQNQNWSLSAESLEHAAPNVIGKELLFSISPTAERLLRRAGELADERQASTIRTRHLLLAILDLGFAADTDSPMAFSWLQQMGLPVAVIRNVLAQVPENAQIISSMFAYSANAAFADIATDEDTLGFEMYTQALAEIIVKPETIPPVVIGVYGPWGSGKSTFMELVKKHLVKWDKEQHPEQSGPGLRRAIKRLFDRQARSPKEINSAEQQPRVICVEYNAWAYTDAEKLWAGLVEKISPYLDEQIPWWKKPLFWLGRSAWRFLGAIIVGIMPIIVGLIVIVLLALWAQVQQWELWTQVITSLTAFVVSLGGSIKSFSNQKPLTQSVGALVSKYDPTEMEGVMSRVQSEFNKTVKDYFLLSAEEKTEDDSDQPDVKKLRQQRLKVVVMIDELDRCPLEKIVDILEAIKIFLAEEIFIVLMAVDTRVVAEAIRLHYKDVKNPNLAREYLEKIIQIPVPVPEASQRQLTDFVSSLMAIEEEDTPDQIERGEVVEPSPPEIETDRLPIERGPLAVSEDLFNPLHLSDTSVERRTITAFGLAYLESNPRRIKRLLNTYRYVKILATRRGERTDQAEWQEKMINWLGCTMRWPTFMGRAIRGGALPSADEAGRVLLEQLNEGLPPRQQLPFEALNIQLPAEHEIARFETLADNFIIESPPAVVAPLPDDNHSDQINEQSVTNTDGGTKNERRRT